MAAKVAIRERQNHQRRQSLLRAKERERDGIRRKTKSKKRKREKKKRKGKKRKEAGISGGATSTSTRDLQTLLIAVYHSRQGPSSKWSDDSSSTSGVRMLESVGEPAGMLKIRQVERWTNSASTAIPATTRRRNVG